MLDCILYSKDRKCIQLSDSSVPANKALFLDRDGIVNRRIVDGYVRSPNELEILPGIIPIVEHARSRGFLVIIITNQQGIGKGLMTTSDLEVVHQAVRQQIARLIGYNAIDAIYVCPHLESQNCECRKPAPGMILDAIRDFDIDPASSWMVGDSTSDAQAGIAAGVPTILVGEFSAGQADITVPDLVSALKVIADS